MKSDAKLAMNAVADFCTTGKQTVMALLVLSDSSDMFWTLFPCYAPLDAPLGIPAGNAGMNAMILRE